MITTRYTFFWGGQDILSQWYPCTFAIDGKRYNCAEQWMMAEKARMFGDTERESLIMQARDPAVQKRLGRQVKGFKKAKWQSAAKNIVFKGNLAKFSQNPELKEYLLSTVGTTLVEASPYDCIWGIGLRATDPKARDRSLWRGKNWLGEVLMRVRAVLQEEADGTDSR